jgi:hypothetical protein
VWWQQIHLDALWPMAQGGPGGFGLCGIHATVNLTERVQVFLGPGVILLRLPTADGSQTWSTGADWGFSYRLGDFNLPGANRPVRLHVNLARVWVLGSAPLPVPAELYLAGFSLSFRPR